MIDYDDLFRDLEESVFAPWYASLRPAIESRINEQTHGHLQEWTELLESLPRIKAKHWQLDQARIQVGTSDELTESQRAQLLVTARRLMPWRKGPFSLFGIDIDTEWRSDWKWDRLAHRIATLQNRRVLDVGCGSGYHCLRMHAAGAAVVIGLEPLLRYNTQFYLLKHFLPRLPVHLLPLTLEGLPQRLAVFDTVFSMGVLYHRRSPFDHLLELKECLAPGGELILETLVVEPQYADVLVPEGRYAKMRNVWFIPSVQVLCGWMRRVGFREVELLDVSVTSLQEQRRSEWMEFESLEQFLDPDDHSKTLEGYPAPTRAILRAIK